MDAKTLNELQIMMQQWHHHSWKVRKRSIDCPAAAAFYHGAANNLHRAARDLKKAILEESAVEK